MGERFIVRELNTSWPKQWPFVPEDLVSGKFEQLLTEQLEQGYRLHSWQLRQYVPPDSPGVQLIETIVAVFEKVSEANP
ncbi:hypothetical protein R5W24_004460 [Gemmata sp. JC717]|uniref:hypothetical protein n=1 Tax=Gemmata algarum TaxID=2975278 RepID=UPI0021BAC4FC|nr:hypothetical protein [Gemmata algarum]MDY3555318.1 hypothetical protein [Gemmata algarum]